MAGVKPLADSYDAQRLRRAYDALGKNPGEPMARKLRISRLAICIVFATIAALSLHGRSVSACELSNPSSCSNVTTFSGVVSGQQFVGSLKSCSTVGTTSVAWVSSIFVVQDATGRDVGFVITENTGEHRILCSVDCDHAGMRSGSHYPMRV